ncbi:hypothetical protein FRC07_007780 [Ceratobasidium sp. 392]|nr:hypothetical protein FRC07_007780 [Ceratobasidium sp. 392]
MYSAPLTFFGAESIVTANRVGTIYVFSLKGQIQYSISVGMNHYIRSILVYEQMIYAVAMGPEGEALLVGYTNDLATHQTSIDARKTQPVPTPQSCGTQAIAHSAHPSASCSTNSRANSPTNRSILPKVQSPEPIRPASELTPLPEDDEAVMQDVTGSNTDGSENDENEPKSEVRDLDKAKLLVRLKFPNRELEAGGSQARSSHTEVTEWSGPPQGNLVISKRRKSQQSFTPGRWTFSESTAGPPRMRDRKVGDIHFCPSNSRPGKYKYWLVERDNSELIWEPCLEGQAHPTIQGYVMRPARNGNRHESIAYMSLGANDYQFQGGTKGLAEPHICSVQPALEIVRNLITGSIPTAPPSAALPSVPGG